MRWIKAKDRMPNRFISVCVKKIKENGDTVYLTLTFIVDAQIQAWIDFAYEWLDESESIISKGEEWIEKERLLCAAIWYKEQPTAKILPVNVKEGVVVAGMRHGHCIHSFVALTGKRSVLPECGEYTQGFITSKDRFVDRKEAMKIARESGQVTKQQSFEELYSEDLY